MTLHVPALRGRGADVLAIIVLLLIPGGPFRSQEQPWPRAHRLSESGGLQLDGQLNEAAWRRADSITAFTQRDPSVGEPGSERTVARFLATDDGLWVGVWAYDREPAAIRRAQLRRDADFDTDDHVILALDSQNDRRSGFLFSVNPNGSLQDAEILNFESQNNRWDGIWDARARITSEGWFAEIFIPWQTMRYPATSEAWGMNLQRFIRRKNEYMLWQSWRRGEGIRFLERQGQLAGLGNLPGRARAEARPYVLATNKLADRRFYDDGRDSVVAGGALSADAGIDVKAAVTNRLTLDVTYNTDFAQAEADQQVVNLTAFPCSFPRRGSSLMKAQASSTSAGSSRRSSSTAGASGCARTECPCPSLAVRG